MPIKMSDKMKILAYRNMYGRLYSIDGNSKLFNNFLIWLHKCRIYFINISRSFLRKLFTSTKNKKINVSPLTSLSKNSEIIKNEIQDKGYAFIENFLDHNFYNFLNKNFPKKYELIKSKDPLKNYNMGFKYVKDKRHLNLEISSAINTFYKFILSSQFENEINHIFNLNKQKLFCKAIITSIAEENSFLIPHIDDISSTRNDLNINFIYFVDGNNDDIEHSGGTSIYVDNEAQNVILKPTTLKNSVMIYNNVANFYHGFKFMKKNCFRKAISFQFINDKDLI